MCIYNGKFLENSKKKVFTQKIFKQIEGNKKNNIEDLTEKK